MKNFDVFFFFLKFNFFRFPRTEPILLDVNESPDHLDDLIKSHNVVVSLLPWTMHPVVAKRCIANKTDMVSLKNNFDFLNSLRSLFLGHCLVLYRTNASIGQKRQRSWNHRGQ